MVYPVPNQAGMLFDAENGAASYYRMNKGRVNRHGINSWYRRFTQRREIYSF